jgi:hypothetical protein
LLSLTSMRKKRALQGISKSALMPKCFISEKGLHWLMN